MKLVSITRVRNEADIIEPFVRHHAQHVDKLVIVDDGSIDGTYDALLALQAEGLPLDVSRDPVVGYEQSHHMSRLLRLAADKFGADWVVPLDADEFIEPPDGKSLADVLHARTADLFSIPWANFAWSSAQQTGNEPNPVIRQRLRAPPSQTHRKVLVPAHLINANTELSQGNHSLVMNGTVLKASPLSEIQLCHFPIRSVEQYAGKVVIGFLQYSAMPNWDGGIGFHYTKPFQAMLSGGLAALTERMESDSHHYSIDWEVVQSPAPKLRDEPLRYRGGALAQSTTQPNFLRNALQCAEDIARDRAAWAKRAGRQEFLRQTTR